MTRTQVAAAAALAVAGIGACRDDSGERVTAAIRDAVAAPEAPAYLRSARWKLVRQIYRDRSYRPLWTDRARPLDRARDLVSTLCHADREGLRPSDYDLAGLRNHLEQIRRAKEREPRAMAALDLRLTALFLAYGADLLAGRLNPMAVDSGWFIRARRSSVDTTLRGAAMGKRFEEMLAPLHPRHREYRELVQSLAHYRAIQSRGDWPRVPGRGNIRPGSHGPRVAALRARLVATGDLRSTMRNDPVYDRDVARAVAQFQRRHGIEPDGRVGPATLAALNVPVAVRIGQIELNLERYRWLPNEFGPRYVLVNIPDYRLHAFDGGREVFDQRVIVGGEYENATPVFADSMTHIVFHPEWHVPRRVLVDELLPRIRESPYFLAEHGYEVVDTNGDSVVTDPAAIDWWDVDSADPGLQLRRMSGPDNPLGRVKFVFPNRFSVYLHDTPSRELFDQPKRTLSHGCVRVENPEELAAYALAGQGGWTEDTIRKAMAVADSTLWPRTRDAARTVRLEHPVPVYLVYLTAFVRRGTIHFRDDPYGRDVAALHRLAAVRHSDAGICRQLETLLGG